MQRCKLLRPDRLRKIEPPFGWVPFRLLSCGLFVQISAPAKLLYFFLCLVADRRGVSFYGDDRLQELLQLSPDALQCARDELVNHDLLAFDQRLYQLLSLPTEPRSHGPHSHPKGNDNGNTAVDAPVYIREILRQLGGAG